MCSCEIERIVYGRSVLPESMIYKGGSGEKFRDIDFAVYVVKGEGFTLLIDAGCETMPGFVMNKFNGSIDALRKAETEVSDITDVFITHSHHDHIENVKYFPNARIHIQRDEYEAGGEYLKNNRNICIFEDECEIYDGVRLIRISGHSKGSSIAEINAHGRTYVVAADECYKRDVLMSRLITGASYSPENSKKFIEKYSDDKYTVLLSHEE